MPPLKSTASMARAFSVFLVLASVLVASADRSYSPPVHKKAPPSYEEPHKKNCPIKCLEYKDQCIHAEIKCSQKTCLKFEKGECNRYEHKCTKYNLECVDKHCTHYDLKCKEYKKVCLWYELDEYHNPICKKEEKFCLKYEQKCTAEDCFNYALQCKDSEKVCAGFDYVCKQEGCLMQHTYCTKTATVCSKKGPYCPPEEEDYKPEPSPETYEPEAYAGGD